MYFDAIEKRRRRDLKEAENIGKAVEAAELHWSAIMEQRIDLAKKELTIEKDSQIGQLQKELKDARREIRRLNSVDLETTKYRDDLIAMTKRLSYRKKMMEGVLSSIGVQVAADDILLTETEKLLKKASKHDD